MKAAFLLAIAALALPLCPLFAEEGLKDQTKPQVAPSDGTFLIEAWRRARTEVHFGDIAARKAGSANVKQLADRITTEQSRMIEEIKVVARQKALKLWGEPDNIRIAEMRQLSGNAFDRSYLTEVMLLHERSIADFDDNLKTTSDPDVKAFLTKNLPILKSQLAALKNLSSGEASAASRSSTGL